MTNDPTEPPDPPKPTERLQELGNIPALSNCAIHLLGALRDDTGAEELEDIIRSDEAVSVAVPRMANSVAMGGTVGTFSLRESIARLGRQNLQRIAVSLQASKVVGDRGRGYGLATGELWAGSVAGALAAQWMARRTKQFDPGLAYVAALLRDIGKVAMEAVFGPDRLLEAFADASEHEPHLELERRTLGIDHAALGAELAEVWRLPEEMRAAIAHHHDATAADGALSVLVHAADTVSMQMGHGVGIDGLRYPRDARVLEHLGVDQGMVDQCMLDVSAELERMLNELGPTDS